MKQTFFKTTKSNIETVIYYVNQSTGDNSTFIANDQTKPCKTIGAAINTIINDSLEKEYHITLLYDYNLSETLSISNVIHHIIIDGNGYKLTALDSIDSFSESNGNIVFSCIIKPKYIIINDEVRNLNESESLKKPLDLPQIGTFETGTTEFKFTKSDAITFELVGGELCELYHNWINAHLEVTQETDGYIYTGPYDNTYINSSAKYRILNSPNNIQTGTFYYTNTDSTYTVIYTPIDSETVSTINVPILESFIKITNCSNLTITGFVICYSKIQENASNQGLAVSDGIIDITSSTNIIIRKNEFLYTDGFAVYINGQSQRCWVDYNYIHDSYGGGIHISGDYYATPASYIEISQNLIKKIGRFHCDAEGVLIRIANHIHVINNTICDTYYTGMNSGWTWGFGIHTADYNIFEYNHIHHCMQMILNDGGGIYTLGKQPHTVIQYNKIHDIYGQSLSGAAGSCIYQDEGSTGILCRYNILFSANHIIKQHYGENNIFFNNVIAHPLDICVKTENNTTHIEHMFIMNIFTSNKDVFNSIFVKNGSVAVYNLFDSTVSDINESEGIVSNYKSLYLIPFDDVSSGNFNITSASNSTLSYSNNTSTDFTIVNLASFNKDASFNISFAGSTFGVTDTTLKSYADLTETFTVNDETLSYTDYYKYLAKTYSSITNAYLG